MSRKCQTQVGDLHGHRDFDQTPKAQQQAEQYIAPTQEIRVSQGKARARARSDMRQPQGQEKVWDEIRTNTRREGRQAFLDRLYPRH